VHQELERLEHLALLPDDPAGVATEDLEIYLVRRVSVFGFSEPDATVEAHLVHHVRDEMVRLPSPLVERLEVVLLRAPSAPSPAG
jgi:hypothetical protein